MPSKGFTNLTIRVDTRKIVDAFLASKRKEIAAKIGEVKPYSSIPAFVEQAVLEKIQREYGQKKSQGAVE